MKNADWGQARMLCPPERYSSQDWFDHYQANPDILTTMLGDLYRVWRSEEAKRLGTGNPAGGRRRQHINGNMDELWSIITPRLSTKPFHLAFAELKGARSLRQFSSRCGINFRTLSRLVQASAGTLKGRNCSLTRWDLEQIAKAGGVHPAFFREYRTMVVQDLIGRMMTDSPNLSITMLRNLSA